MQGLGATAFGDGLPLSEMITEVKDVKGGMPNIFTLQLNYPNPFNPREELKVSGTLKTRDRHEWHEDKR